MLDTNTLNNKTIIFSVSTNTYKKLKTVTEKGKLHVLYIFRLLEKGEIKSPKLSD